MCGAIVARLRPQPRPLADAEAVLLVHDDEAEIGEDDRVLDQRVRADEDMDDALLQAIEDRAALRDARAARQQFDIGPLLRRACASKSRLSVR